MSTERTENVESLYQDLDLTPETRVMFEDRIRDLGPVQIRKLVDAIRHKDPGKRRNILRLLQGLNPEQLEAVVHDHAAYGPLLILACAGSGKTTALTYRIAYLLLTGVPPSNIMAVTFTVKAAEEMRIKIKDFMESISAGSDKLLAPSTDISGLWMDTFHSICLRILREEVDGKLNCERVGLPPGFGILEYSYGLLKRSIDEVGARGETVDEILSKINHIKSEGMDLETFRLKAKKKEESSLRVFEMYQKKMSIRGLVDFDDLLIMTNKLFKENPGILEYYRKRFEYLLVDEYQDTNYAQYIFCKMLTGESNSIFVVGDDDQSIYAWRGANIRNILYFEKDFPSTVRIDLVKNYRSTANIIAAANRVFLRSKPKSLRKVLRPTKSAGGEKIVSYHASDDADEARFVVGHIKKLMEQNPGLDFSDFAVLYRLNFQSENIKEALVKEGMDFSVYDPHFWTRYEIKDIMSYLSVLAYIMDPGAFKQDDRRKLKSEVQHLYNLPPCSFTRDEILAATHEYEPWKIFTDKDGLNRIANRLFNYKAKEGLYKLFNIFHSIKKHETDLLRITDRLIYDTGYKSGFQKDGRRHREEDTIIKNIEQFRKEVESFERPRKDIPPAKKMYDFYAYLRRRIEDSKLKRNLPPMEKRGAINMMTLHSAKGLEFDTVFFTGLQEGFIPHMHYTFRFQHPRRQKEILEEERRLFYVGVTRARERLIISYFDRSRKGDKVTYYQPSRFIRVFPSNILIRMSFYKGFFPALIYHMRKIILGK